MKTYRVYFTNGSHVDIDGTHVKISSNDIDIESNISIVANFNRSTIAGIQFINDSESKKEATNGNN